MILETQSESSRTAEIRHQSRFDESRVRICALCSLSLCCFSVKKSPPPVSPGAVPEGWQPRSRSKQMPVSHLAYGASCVLIVFSLYYQNLMPHNSHVCVVISQWQGVVSCMRSPGVRVIHQHASG